MEEEINKEDYKQFQQETYKIDTELTYEKIKELNKIYEKDIYEGKYDNIKNEEFKKFIINYSNKFDRFNNNKHKFIYCVMISLLDFLKMNIFDNKFKELYINDDINNTSDKDKILDKDKIFDKYNKIFNVDENIIFKLSKEEIEKNKDYKIFYLYFSLYIQYYKSMFHTYYNSKYYMINFKIKEEILIKILKKIKTFFTQERQKELFKKYITNLIKQYNYIYLNCKNDIINKINIIINDFNENNIDKFDLLKINKYNFKNNCPLHLYYQQYITQPNIFNDDCVRIKSLKLIFYRLVNYISYLYENNYGYKLNYNDKYKLYNYLITYYKKLFSKNILNYDIFNLFNIVDVSKIRINDLYYAFSIPSNYTFSDITKFNVKQNDFFINNTALDYALSQEKIGIIINLTNNKNEDYLIFHNKHIIYENDIFEHSIYKFDKSNVYKNYYNCYNDKDDFYNCLIRNTEYNVLTFKKWPDADIPDCNMIEYIEFIKYIFYLQSYLKTYGKNFEIGVHCHAGIGRTGTFIVCLDIFNKSLKEIEYLKKKYFTSNKQQLIIDYNNIVLNYFINIRILRPRCIQTVKQLLFVNNFVFALSNNFKVSKDIYGNLEYFEDYNMYRRPFSKDFDYFVLKLNKYYL